MAKDLAIVLICVVALGGCAGGDSQTAQEFVDSVKKEKQAKVLPVPEIQEYKSYEYKAAALRNPFESNHEAFVEPEKNKDKEVAIHDGMDVVFQQPRPDADRKREPLESYGLDSIKMMGSIKKGKNFWGIVKDKTGLIHRVHVGNYLGENSGCIRNITDNKIELEEIISDGQGGWAQRSAAIKITQ